MIEVLVAAAVGCLLLAGGLVIYLFSVTSFASMANYSDMNRKSRFASDMISRDIRSCLSIVSATANQLSLNEPSPDGTTVYATTYTYDPNAGTLNRWQNGETKLLLTGVDSLFFVLYQKPATNSSAAFEQYPTTTVITNAKLISFQWSCSRAVRPLQTESESLEAGIVEIRNQ